MMTVHFDVAVDFEPSPDRHEIEAITDQLREILEGAEIDFCGSLEIADVTLVKPDRRKARKVMRVPERLIAAYARIEARAIKAEGKR